jgi:hypothetical protein
MVVMLVEMMVEDHVDEAEVVGMVEEEVVVVVGMVEGAIIALHLVAMTLTKTRQTPRPSLEI